MSITKYDPANLPWKIAKDFRVPTGFIDVSWHNDTCPSIFHEASKNTLYWDTENCDNIRRELNDFEYAIECDRFFVTDEDSKTLYAGNDIQHALFTARGDKCRWFRNCKRTATIFVKHPVLGDIPCCEKCASFANGGFTRGAKG